MSQTTLAALREKYPYIVAYCQYMGSVPYYLERELREAAATDAPENAYAQKYDFNGPTAQWYVTDGSQTWAKSVKEKEAL